jgi:uncharacterized membrane protein
VRTSLRVTLLLLSAGFATAFAFSLQAQTARAQTPAPQDKKQPVGPPAPQSTHFPILLLAFGAPADATSDSPPSWSLRIGQKGPERLDRPNYPPAFLEPVEVAREGNTDVWNYRAKDSATGAEVTVRLTRESCTVDNSGAKYTFRAIAAHSQLGALNGCARIAAELFPKITNQTDTDDDDTDKKPQVLPADLIKFKSPVAYAYLNPTGKAVFKRGTQARLVTPSGNQLAPAEDGQHMVYTHEEEGGDRTIFVFDAATGKSTPLVRGAVQEPFLSPDGTRFAFLKLIDSHWNLFVASITAPDNAVIVYNGDLLALDGWVDARTLLASSSADLYWISDDGRTQQTVPLSEAYGPDFGLFALSSANKVRINPINPDLLLVSADLRNPQAGTPSEHGHGAAMFMYEVRSKRRTPLPTPSLLAGVGEWSRDGVQIFFNGIDSGRHTAIYRMLWDGSEPKRFLTGSDLAVGQ